MEVWLEANEVIEKQIEVYAGSEYYCDRLHRIYTIPAWAVFNASAAPTGNSGLYRPCFTRED